MKPIKIAINGFGRIGRVLFRIIWQNPAFEIVAINSPAGSEMGAHLLKYDSIYGVWPKEVSAESGFLIVDGTKIPFLSEREVKNLPWEKFGVDLVIESSGKAKHRADAQVHLEQGSKYVFVTSPMKDPDIAVVNGVNDGLLNLSEHKVISAASCTSICSALTLKVLVERVKILHGFISTVHAFTNDQSLHDATHKDMRRARSATQSIIPTSTGVTETIGTLFPELKGKFSGVSLRVPVIVPSIINCTVELDQPVDSETVNSWFIEESKNRLNGKLQVTNLPLVSVDFKQTSVGATVDMLSTKVVDGRMLNLLVWYDNEWGFTSQVVGLLELMATKISV